MTNGRRASTALTQKCSQKCQIGKRKNTTQHRETSSGCFPLTLVASKDIIDLTGAWRDIAEARHEAKQEPMDLSGKEGVDFSEPQSLFTLAVSQRTAVRMLSDHLTGECHTSCPHDERERQTSGTVKDDEVHSALSWMLVANGVNPHPSVLGNIPNSIPFQAAFTLHPGTAKLLPEEPLLGIWVGTLLVNT